MLDRGHAKYHSFCCCCCPRASTRASTRSGSPSDCHASTCSGSPDDQPVVISTRPCGTACHRIHRPRQVHVLER